MTASPPTTPPTMAPIGVLDPPPVLDAADVVATAEELALVAEAPLADLEPELVAAELTTELEEAAAEPMEVVVGSNARVVVLKALPSFSNA